MKTTGRIRYRPLRRWGQTLLVLEIELECESWDTRTGRPMLRRSWRDARVEDLPPEIVRV